MDPKVVVRDETRDDVCAIAEVTIAAFATLEISNHTEQFVLEALRSVFSRAYSAGHCGLPRRVQSGRTTRGWRGSFIRFWE
jgi:hypothetical protein